MSESIRLQRSDERNVHSQNGEDGVLARIFATLGIERGVAVEFGAWDGVHLSNTAALREKGWRTVLIEADAGKVKQLQRLANEQTAVICAMVASQGETSIDRILDRHAIDEVDLLSIDIDGDDIHVLSGLRRRPKVVCIEFNPTLAPPLMFVNPPGTCQGSSLAALCGAAAKLGYELVYATFCNAFFVRQPEAKAFLQADLFAAYHSVERPAIGSLYDGGFLVHNPSQGPYRHEWTTVPIFVPPLPRALRSWPPTMPRVLLAYLYSAVVAPFFYAYVLLKVGLQLVRRRARG